MTSPDLQSQRQSGMRGTLRRRDLLFASGWLVCLLAIGAAKLQPSAEPDNPNLGALNGVPLTRVSSEVQVSLPERAETSVLVFLDPRCSICIDKSSQLIATAEALSQGEVAYVVLAQFSEVASMLVEKGYPAEQLYIVPDTSVLRALNVRYVPTFAALGAEESLYFSGLPNKPKVWLFKLSRKLKSRFSEGAQTP